MKTINNFLKIRNPETGAFEALPGVLGNVVDMIYPVGSIYMSVNAASPATLFGGEWEQIKDTFLLSAGDTYTAGATGGEASVQLTQENYAYKTVFTYASSITDGTVLNGRVSAATTGYGFNSIYGDINVNTPHNNMPPYLTVYMWQRTA